MNRAGSLACVSGMGAIVFLACLYAERYQPGAVLAAPLLFTAGIVVVAACMGKPWALKICLFVLIFSMGASIKSATSTEAATVYKLALWSTAFVIGLANLPASVRLLQNLPSLGLLAYLVLAITSTTYSVDPSYTLASAVTTLFLVPFMAAAVARLSVNELLVTLLLALGAHVGLALLLWFVAPEVATSKVWVGQPRLRGLTGHPFYMADVAGLCVLCTLLMWRERWLSTQALIGIAGLGVAALLLSGARSAMAATALAAFSVGRYRPVAIVLAVLALFSGLLAVYLVPSALDTIAYQLSRGGNAESTLTLTGRIHIWQQSIVLFEQRPLLGYGYASTRILFLSEFIPENSVSADTPPHAHNVIMQSLVTTGILGTAILLIPLLYPVIHALRNANSIINPFACFVITMGMTDAAPMAGTPGLVTLFWMISLFLAQSATLDRVKDRAVWSDGATGASAAYLANRVARSGSGEAEVGGVLGADMK